MKTLIGPFSQILTLRDLPLKGPIKDHQIGLIKEGGVLTENGKILEVNSYKTLKDTGHPDQYQEIENPSVLIPGFIDSHTHICFGGNRADEYALRNLGKSYLDIAASGGGIWNTVQKTRATPPDRLLSELIERIHRHESRGITSIEIKSGYGLDISHELVQLETIQKAQKLVSADLFPTCLAAHIKPKDFKGTSKEYLNFLVKELLPKILEKKLAKRVDITIQEGAFTPDEALPYLTQAHFMGFDITLHADQFSSGGSYTGFGLEALSIGHLEAITDRDIAFLARTPIVGVALPGASLGLGMPFAPVRKILDEGACLAIASDWNPGSAPMGNLLVEASILGSYEKLSNAEVLAGLTFRAGAGLNLLDTGRLETDFWADMQSYPTLDYREILYYQGSMTPKEVWKKGKSIFKA